MNDVCFYVHLCCASIELWVKKRLGEHPNASIHVNIGTRALTHKDSQQLMVSRGSFHSLTQLDL